MAKTPQAPSPCEGAKQDRLESVSRLLAELAVAPSLPVTGAWEEALRPGDRLDRFEIRALLGRGGFGTVYEAWDGELGRAVALKTLRASSARGDVSSASIKREAEAVARLNHAGIVTLHDVCQSSRGYYLVMERLRGVTLAQRLRDGPLTWKDAVRVARGVADALAHAHERGILHRDLKPANVFLCEDGRVKLVDFGLAHLLGSETSGSGGTPAYMAPEQARGEPVDARADVYALGVVLFEMIHGELPRQHEGERGVPGRRAPPGFPSAPPHLARLVGRMLARDAGNRLADGSAAAAALATFEGSLERRRKRSWLAGALAACGAAVALALALQPPRLPAGRLVMVMADLDNRTDDPDLNNLGELFGAALEQSRRVSLMDRDTLVRALTKGGVRPSVIGEAEAIDAARMASAQLVLVPTLRPVRGGVELAVRVFDQLRGQIVFAAHEKSVAKVSLYAAMDRLAVRVRQALAEDASEAPRSPVPIASFAPAKPEALRLFSEGERLYSELDARGAKAKWEAAVALDPSFPLPRLALLQGSIGTFVAVGLDRASALEHARALRRDLARLPDALRPWAETVIVKVEDGYANHTEYLAALDRAIAARPEQPAPYFAASNELLLARADGAAARPYVDRALQLAPLAGLGDLIDYLVVTERLDEALEQVRRWAEDAPAPAAMRNLCIVHAARGELDQALAATRALQETWGLHCTEPYVDALLLEELDAARARSPMQPPPIEATIGNMFAAWRKREELELLTLRGRARESLRLLDGAPVASMPPKYASFWLDVRAAVLLARGDGDGAARAVAASADLSGPTPIHAWLLAEAGELRLAKALGRHAPDRLLSHRIARALHDWKSGDAGGALAELSAIATPPSHFYQGAILAELGRHREAVEAHRRYRRLRSGALATAAGRFDHLLLPRSLYLEASSLEAIGDREGAREVVGRLLRLWDRADADLPLLAEANALERRLRTE